MFGSLRQHTATLSYKSSGSYDSDGNFIEGVDTEIEIKCSIQPRLTNKKLTSSNLENVYSFAVFTDVINYLPKTGLKITIDNIIYDVLSVFIFPILSDMKILVK